MAAKALLLAASVAVQAFGAIQQASAARQAAENEAQQIQQQKDLDKLQALQAEVQERKELQLALGSQSAQAAAQGLGLGEGGSIGAIQRDSRLKTTQNVKNIRFMSQARARQYQLGIKSTLDAGKAAVSGALFSGLSGIASTGVSAYQTGMFNTGAATTSTTVSGGQGFTAKGGTGQMRF